MKDLFICDFDGVITNIRKESKTYIAIYKTLLAKSLQISQKKLHEYITVLKLDVLNQPNKYGFIYHGYNVAPAESDPYIFYRVIASLVINKLNKENPTPHIAKIFKDSDLFLDGLYNESYLHITTTFKKYAKTFIKDLTAIGELIFVTNSQTDIVKKKLQMLMGENDIKVIGNSRKYYVSSSQLKDIPMIHEPLGSPRKVFLRRKYYYDALMTIHRPISAVIGDVYELDLSLPESMGIFTVLVTSPYTPLWEKHYYLNHNNGFHSSSLLTIKNRLIKIATDIKK